MLRGGRAGKLLALARAADTSPGELLADFQEFYGIDLYGWLFCGRDPDDRDAGRWAVLMAQLPRRSRLVAKEAPDAAMGEAESLLWRIEYNQRAALPRKAGAKAPKPVPLPSERAEQARTDAESLAAKDDVDRLLGM